MRFRLRLTAALMASILPVIPGAAVAQDGDDLAKINRFEGGRIDVTLGAASLPMLGPGAGGLQASVAPVYPGPGRHNHNPALLGLARRPLLALDLSPRFDLDLGARFDLDREVAEATEEALDGHLSPDAAWCAGDPSAALGHPGGLSGLVLVVPTGPVSVGLSVDEPVLLDLGLFATGMQCWGDIEKTVGDDVEVVHLRADMDLSSHLSLRSQRYSLAVGGAVRPDLWTGLGLDILRAQARVSSLLDVEGVMATSGREFHFDDPADSWENSLDQRLDARYAGGAWALRLGAGWRPGARWALGMSFVAARPLELTGSATLSLRRLAAWDDEEGGIDPAALSLSRPTETAIVQSPVDDAVRLDLPHTLGLGAALLAGPLTATIDYQAYWGGFSISYLDARCELNPRHLLALGLYTPWASLSAGALLCEPRTRVDGTWEEAGLVPLPRFSLGAGSRVAERLRLDVMLEVAPLPALKLSTGILF
ncbi:MAG: hypothetical protein JW819_09360 [Candidatus Krumholzibacteriota bacterium]|nr:hypothetical protein [Candidatus Krumholzibacteriota bacterium]